ncbi:MAG: hypothetical protein AB7O74_02665 [Candidatus Nanopelagicales bacterium]
MPITVMRRLIVALVAVIGGALLLLDGGSATAAENDLGWVRLQAATGNTDESVLALTQTACPTAANAVVVRMTGPGITTDVGNLVGVTQIKAFDETVSGQLWIPLQFVFDQWFQVNGVKPKPNAEYTIAVTCRDLLRSSKTYGSFIGAVAFDGKGGYQAVGESSKPFDTELKPLDPVVGGAVPSPAASQAPGGTNEGGSGSQDGGAQAGATAPGDGPAAAAGSEADQQGTAAGETALPGAAPSGDNTARNVVLGASLLLVLGIAVMALLNWLRGRREPDHGAHGAEVPRRDKVDAL